MSNIPVSNLRYGALFDKAWFQIRDNLPLVAALTLVYMLAIAVLSWIPALGWLFGAALTPGYLVALLKITKKESIGFNDFFWGFLDFNRFLHAVLLYALILAMVAFGFLMLIIPGIYLAITISLASTCFVIKKQDAVDAIKTSIHLAGGHWWFVSGFLCVIGILHILGAMCFGVGILIAHPVSVLMYVALIEALEANSVDPVKPESVTQEQVKEINI